MKETKLVLTQELLDELCDIIKAGSILEKSGKKIRERAENILSCYATYGVEIPNKKIEKLRKDINRTSAWTPFN